MQSSPCRYTEALIDFGEDAEDVTDSALASAVQQMRAVRHEIEAEIADGQRGETVSRSLSAIDRTSREKPGASSVAIAMRFHGVQGHGNVSAAITSK